MRVFAPLLALLAVISCANKQLTEPRADLGNFGLGLNIVVADNVQMVPISRPATVEEWETAMQLAIDERFGRYTGTKAYNLGIAVDGYALAPPGIPIIASPKSVLVITANIWDDAAQLKLNEEGKQLMVFENLTPEEVIGSGLTKTREQQMAALAFNAAYAVEQWLMEHPEWFAAVAAVAAAQADAEMAEMLRAVSDGPAAEAPAN